MDIEQLYSVRHDLSPEYIRSILLDEDEYLSNYSDVKTSHIPAGEHFINHGFEEGRKYSPSKVRIIKSNPKSQRRLFYSNAPTSNASFKYRCLYKARETDLVYAGNTPVIKLIKALFHVSELIFSRPEISDSNKYIISLARLLSVKISFDYDDLLTSEHSGELGHVRSKNSNYEGARINSIKKAQYLHHAERITCSTPLIAHEMKKMGFESEVLRNTLPKSMFLSLNKVNSNLTKKKNRQRIKLLYMSGSQTHKRDFSIVSGPLMKAMQEYSDSFELTFLGDVGIDINVFKSLGVKCSLIKRVNFDEMLEIISDSDICLVPLEDTIFNNAKSNIKFIECASQGVPVISSNVSEYRLVSSYKNNSIILCESDSDWYKRLISIIDNKNDLYEMSLNAYRTALENFSE